VEADHHEQRQTATHEDADEQAPNSLQAASLWSVRIRQAARRRPSAWIRRRRPGAHGRSQSARRRAQSYRYTPSARSSGPRRAVEGTAIAFGAAYQSEVSLARRGA
jgi:hypothetical protein